MLSAVYAESHMSDLHAVCQYDECRYVVYHYAECRGAFITSTR
jgi:hypothetical protein